MKPRGTSAPEIGLVFRIVCVCVASVLGACSAQVEPSYLGETLAELRGTIVDGPKAGADSPVTVATLRGGEQVGVSWIPSRGHYVSGSGSVTLGEAPQFTLTFYAPPPTDAMSPEWDGEQVIAMGHVVIYGQDRFEPMIYRYGYALDALVLYFARDPRPSGGEYDTIVLAARRYGVPARRGYHTVRMILGDRAERDLCRWNGICEDRSCELARERSLPPPGITELWKQDFVLCTQVLPDAPVCDGCSGSHTACPLVTPMNCGELASYEPNPDGHSIPVTITLGATLRDLLL
ncbi:MAG TPA: hypothetical protein VK550_25670 [Polyangiaceae bacterium]|nr:hypothetical protein [Polyangiaceae bacterium]